MATKRVRPSILSQSVNPAKLYLNLRYTLGARQGGCARRTLWLVRAFQPPLLGMIAMAILGEQSPNDLNFSVKTQAKSALEILVLAMLAPPVPLKACGI